MSSCASNQSASHASMSDAVCVRALGLQRQTHHRQQRHEHDLTQAAQGAVSYCMWTGEGKDGVRGQGSVRR